MIPPVCLFQTTVVEHNVESMTSFLMNLMWILVGTDCCVLQRWEWCHSGINNVAKHYPLVVEQKKNATSMFCSTNCFSALTKELWMKSSSLSLQISTASLNFFWIFIVAVATLVIYTSFLLATTLNVFFFVLTIECSAP